MNAAGPHFRYFSLLLEGLARFIVLFGTIRKNIAIAANPINKIQTNLFRFYFKCSN
jgi:hypothetical protein